MNYNPRFYSPYLNRFVQPDSIVPNPANPQSLNRYSYVRNNPIIYIDPTGHFEELEEGACVKATDEYDCTKTDAYPKSYGDKYGHAIITNKEQHEEARAGLGQAVDIVAGFTPGLSTVDDFLGTVTGCPISCQIGLTEELGSFKRGLAAAGLWSSASGQSLQTGAKWIDEAMDGVRTLCSFDESTLVMTQDGPKPISEIEEGDLVLTYNEETGEVDYYPVTAVWAHEDDEITYLVIDGELIITTPDHPFYTADGEWVAVADLAVGEEVMQANGEYGLVESNTTTTQTEWMYNLTVDTAHTYFVGDGQWLVHNKCRFKMSRVHHAFSDHAGVWGLTGNWNKEQGQRLLEILTAHADRFNPIKANYRGQSALFHYDPATALTVVTDTSGELLAAFRFDADQIWHLFNTGNVH